MLLIYFSGIEKARGLIRSLGQKTHIPYGSRTKKRRCGERRFFWKKGQKHPAMQQFWMFSPVKGHKYPLSAHQNTRSRKYDRNELIQIPYLRSLTNSNLSPPFYIIYEDYRTEKEESQPTSDAPTPSCRHAIRIGSGLVLSLLCPCYFLS